MEWEILINVFVAVGTISLAVIAFLTIRQGYGMQKAEHKRRHLLEIIDTASDIIKLVTERSYYELTNQKDLVSAINTTYFSFEAMTGRVEYIESIIFEFDQDLKKTVANMGGIFNAHIELLVQSSERIEDILGDDTLRRVKNAKSKK